MNERAQIAELKEQIKVLEEQLNFFRLAMEQLPAKVYINELKESGDVNTLINVAIEFIATFGSNDQLATALEEIHRLRSRNQLCSLSKREREILKLIAGGLIDKEIARQLNISFQTAKTHRYKLIHKLNLRNTAGIVAFAKDCGL